MKNVPSVSDNVPNVSIDSHLISSFFPIPFTLFQHPQVSPYLFPQYYTAVEARKEMFAQAKTSPYWAKVVATATSVNLSEEVAFNALLVASTINAYGLSNAIINAFYLISQLADKGKGLMTDDAFLDSFGWELLRCNGPAFACDLQKDTTVPTSTGEHFRIAKGTRLITFLALVNRDQTVYSEPHVFKMDRFNPLPARDLANPRPRTSGDGMEEPLPVLTFGCPFGLMDDVETFHKSHQCVFRRMAQPFMKEFIKIIVEQFEWTLNEETMKTMQHLHLPSRMAGDVTGVHAEFDFHPKHIYKGDNGGVDSTVKIKGGAWFDKFQSIDSQ
jgi:hypothetical protein